MMAISQLVHWWHTISAVIFVHLGSCVTPSLIPEMINDNHRTNWTNSIVCPKQCLCSLQLSLYVCDEEKLFILILKTFSPKKLLFRE